MWDHDLTFFFLCLASAQKMPQKNEPTCSNPRSETTKNTIKRAMVFVKSRDIKLHMKSSVVSLLLLYVARHSFEMGKISWRPLRKKRVKSTLIQPGVSEKKINFSIYGRGNWIGTYSSRCFCFEVSNIDFLILLVWPFYVLEWVSTFWYCSSFSCCVLAHFLR